MLFPSSRSYSKYRNIMIWYTSRISQDIRTSISMGNVSYLNSMLRFGIPDGRSMCIIILFTFMLSNPPHSIIAWIVENSENLFKSPKNALLILKELQTHFGHAFLKQLRTLRSTHECDVEMIEKIVYA